jgi:hypothetical protein
VFPKGGIKIHNIPITWGYLLLGIFSLFALLRMPILVQKDRIYAFIFLIPFLLVSAVMMLTNGITDLGQAISFWISFLFLPFAFMFLFSKNIDTLDLSFFFKIFRRGIYFIAVYGIALFFLKYATGLFLEIPLLTVNLGDLGTLEDNHINRGLLFKLISTYNNGNIFGVCLLILFPLYCFLEQSFFRRLVVKTALFLTLSRSVWIGLLVHELLFPLFITKNIKKFFMVSAIVLSVFLFLLVSSISFYGFSIAFLFDRSLGGRILIFEKLRTLDFFSKEPFAGLSEMVYPSIAIAFGWIALPLFVIACLDRFCIRFYRGN